MAHHQISNCMPFTEFQEKTNISIFRKLLLGLHQTHISLSEGRYGVCSSSTDRWARLQNQVKYLTFPLSSYFFYTRLKSIALSLAFRFAATFN